MDAVRWGAPQLAEKATWAFGLAGLAVWGIFQLGVAQSARHDLDRFATARARTISNVPDQSLWSMHRILAWRDALNQPFPAPLAVLRIPRLRLEVAVLPGTDDRTLDRGVGLIDETAPPGFDGNTGIAGHRDGFFRPLKDVVPGDAIEMDTLDTTDVYRVERAWVVNPDEVSVLDPTPAPALTLVTCFPFYFVGSAPQRFIVRAVRVGRERLPGSRTQSTME